MTDLDPLPPQSTIGILRLMATYGLRRKDWVRIQISEPGREDRIMGTGVRQVVDRLIEEGLMEELEDGTIRLSDDGHLAIRYFYENYEEVYIPAP